jgi:hypothetical protein
MKNNYKNVLSIALMALLMISAQGVEAKDPPKTKYQRHQNYINSNAPRLMIVRHHGESFLFTSGIFYKRGYDEFFEVKAPIGVRVKHIPRKALQVRVHHGFIFKYRGTFYKKAHRGRGYVVIPAPYFRHRNY